jgi:hypothetical protein
MFGNQNPTTQQPFGVQDQMTCSQQQALPVALVAGTRKIAVKALSEVYNKYAAPAPSSQRGKK